MSMLAMVDFALARAAEQEHLLLRPGGGFLRPHCLQHASFRKQENLMILENKVDAWIILTILEHHVAREIGAMKRK